MMYVYMPVMKEQVANYMRDFNNHRIRKQRGQYRPHGIVNDIYEVPTAFGKVFAAFLALLWYL